jgi:hypothetical protein
MRKDLFYFCDPCDLNEYKYHFQEKQFLIGLIKSLFHGKKHF